MCAVLAGGDTYLASTPFPAYKPFFVHMGWQPVPAARNWSWSSDLPADGYVLDLTRIGVEPWIGALMSGQSPPKGLELHELERAVQGALVHWHDDGWLAASELWESAPFALISIEARGADALRRTIKDALERVKPEADDEQQVACRALELAYMAHGVSHEAAAERLAVSRATLYRLLKRGIHALVVGLTAS